MRSTNPVPRISESGIFRRGFLTSPAVNVMLFQASEENSEPTCTTARITSTIHKNQRPAHAHLDLVQRVPSGVLPELAPVRPEVSRNRRGVASHREGQQNQRRERKCLGRGEDVLNQRAQLHAEDVYDGEKNHDADASQVGGVDADLHVAQHHRPYRKRRYVGDVPEPMCRRNDWKKDAEKLAEGHGHCGDGPCLDDQEERPAIEKTPQRSQRLAQVDVLAAGLGHHGRQLAVAERGGEGQDGRHHPRAQKQRRGAGAAGNVRADNVDAGADHRSDHYRGGAEEAKALHQPGRVGWSF